MPPEDQGLELDDSTVAAVRAAAAGLASQHGRGVPRSLMLQLVRSAQRPMTILDGRPPVAVIRQSCDGTSTMFSTLTPRERDVASLLATGRSNRQIASELVITVPTVKDHVHRILRKTGLPSRAAVGAAWRG